MALKKYKKVVRYVDHATEDNFDDFSSVESGDEEEPKPDKDDDKRLALLKVFLPSLLNR